MPVSVATRATIAWQAIADQGRFFRWLPDHRVAADQAIIAFQAQTATGKLKAADHADRPQRMPLFGQAVLRPLAGDRQSVELPAQTDREIADVDHLLDFAAGFAGDLAGFQRDQLGQLDACCSRSARPICRTNSPRRGAGTCRQA